MKTIIRVLILALALVISEVNAQGIQGIVTYKVKRNADIKFDTTKTNTYAYNQMKNMIKHQLEKTYMLSFNEEESLYKQKKSSALKKTDTLFKFNSFGNAFNTGILYKNIKENRWVDQKNIKGNTFLVKDEIDKIDWTLTSESKHIGRYKCFKATYVRKVEVITTRLNSNSNIENLAGEKNQSKIKERIVTAWYTPRIPVSNGPDKYQGLPGLILEIHDGDLSIVLNKIKLNPKQKVEIEAPTKGEEISQEKYDQIIKENSKKIIERFAPRN